MTAPQIFAFYMLTEILCRGNMESKSGVMKKPANGTARNLDETLRFLGAGGHGIVSGILYSSAFGVVHISSMSESVEILEILLLLQLFSTDFDALDSEQGEDAGENDVDDDEE